MFNLPYRSVHICKPRPFFQFLAATNRARYASSKRPVTKSVGSLFGLPGAEHHPRNATPATSSVACLQANFVVLQPHVHTAVAARRARTRQSLACAEAMKVEPHRCATEAMSLDELGTREVHVRFDFIKSSKNIKNQQKQ